MQITWLRIPAGNVFKSQQILIHFCFSPPLLTYFFPWIWWECHKNPKFNTPVPITMAVRCLLLVSPLVCEVTLMCLQIWDVPRASVQCECSSWRWGWGWRYMGTFPGQCWGRKERGKLLLATASCLGSAFGARRGVRGVPSFVLWGTCVEPVPCQSFILLVYLILLVYFYP